MRFILSHCVGERMGGSWNKGFTHKLLFQVWIEPEGLTSDVAYPNGISMGFPRDVQEQIVRSIKGYAYPLSLPPPTHTNE